MAIVRLEVKSPPAPNLPVAPNQYSVQHFDVLNNVLRLYFNRLSSALAALFDNGGGRLLSFPYFSAYQNGHTTLTAAIANATSTADIQVTSTANFASSGYIVIEQEIIGYTATTATTFTGTITRGALGTSAGKASHAIGTQLGEAAPAPIGTAVSAKLDTLIMSSGFTCAFPDSKVYIDNAGVYNIQFSAQFLNYTTAEDNVTVWFTKNGNIIDNSASVEQISQKHGADPGASILALNFVDEFAAGDYVELNWSSNTGETILATFPPATSPTRPASPSLILTITFVSAPTA